MKISCLKLYLDNKRCKTPSNVRRLKFSIPKENSMKHCNLSSSSKQNDVNNDTIIEMRILKYFM